MERDQEISQFPSTSVKNEKVLTTRKNCQEKTCTSSDYACATNTFTNFNETSLSENSAKVYVEK